MDIKKKKDGTPDLRNSNGGAGRNQGRKKLPKSERKVAVSVFVQQKHISKAGGMKKAKELVLNTLEAD